MNQENLNLLEDAKNDLKKIIGDFENFHTKKEGSLDSLDIKETEFAKWYYEEGKVFDRFSSYRFLEKLYADLIDSYNEYFEKEKSPVQKGFFSDGVSKRKSRLHDIFKKTITAESKLHSAIDMFIDNVERSEIIQRATANDQEIHKNKEPKQIIIEDTPLEVSEIEENTHIIQSEDNISESENIETAQDSDIVNEEPIEIISEDIQETEELEEIDISEDEVEENTHIIQSEDNISESENIETAQDSDIVNEETEEIDISEDEVEENTYVLEVENNIPQSENIETVEDSDIVNEEPIEVISENTQGTNESEEIDVVELESVQEIQDTTEEDELEELRKMLEDDFEKRIKSLEDPE